jgi:non-homologous end joining protein Ku
MYDDHYEDALKDLLKKKQEGKLAERSERRAPANVVSLSVLTIVKAVRHRAA